MQSQLLIWQFFLHVTWPIMLATFNSFLKLCVNNALTIIWCGKFLFWIYLIFGICPWFWIENSLSLGYFLYSSILKIFLLFFTYIYSLSSLPIIHKFYILSCPKELKYSLHGFVRGYRVFLLSGPFVLTVFNSLYLFCLLLDPFYWVYWSGVKLLIFFSFLFFSLFFFFLFVFQQDFSM